MKTTDIVFEICEKMLRNSPERSYKRLNPALRSTLANCIEADLPFQEDTFGKVYKELLGGWWFGDGAGSSVGEHFYTLACGVNHASAQQSFERFAGRPGCLWEEDAKTPVRLHVGSRLTWKGQFVTVTSMRVDSLVACTYQNVDRVEGLNIGGIIGYGSGTHRIIESSKVGGRQILTVAKAKEERFEEVRNRFIIPYSEIAEMRKTAKARVKAIIALIASCDPTKDADKLTKQINAEHFRHFELEEINAAFQKRKEWMADAGKMEAWRAGKNGVWFESKNILLRVNGGRVECSNGNSISRRAAVAVLPVLIANRKRPVSLAVPVDGYCVKRVSDKGVQVGCTLVPWSEIDLITPKLIGEDV